MYFCKFLTTGFCLFGACKATLYAQKFASFPIRRSLKFEAKTDFSNLKHIVKPCQAVSRHRLHTIHPTMWHQKRAGKWHAQHFGALMFLRNLQQKGDWPVIDKRHTHIRAKLPLFHTLAPHLVTGTEQELAIQRDGQFRCSSQGKARPGA